MNGINSMNGINGINSMNNTSASNFLSQPFSLNTLDWKVVVPWILVVILAIWLIVLGIAHNKLKNDFVKKDTEKYNLIDS